MPDTIDVSTGSQTSVETDDLFLAAATLSALAVDARDWSHEAAMARCITQWSADAAPFGFAESELTRSSAVLQDTASAAENLGVLVETAATSYAAGEQRSADVSSLLFALGAFIVGGVARNVIVGTLPLAPAVAVAALIAQHPTARRLVAVVGQPLAVALAEHSDLLANPVFVSLVRHLVSSADDIAMGLAGVAPPVAQYAGDQGAGIVGLSGMAAAVLVLSGRHAYTPTPVSVTASTPRPVAPPVSLTDAASRIPSSGTGQPQIRVERFEPQGGRSKYAVYIAGTSTFSTGSDEPFDLPSNLAGIAGDDAAAYLATLDAMEEAGIQPGDEVSLVGHSQGGLVAARIAASGTYDTDALITFGSPTGQIAIPDDVAHLAVEHAEDITPALGGDPVPGADGRHRVVVTRGLSDGSLAATGAVVNAHQMAGYAETAALVDASDDPRLDEVKDAVAAMSDGTAVGSSTLYRAVRERG